MSARVALLCAMVGIGTPHARTPVRVPLAPRTLLPRIVTVTAREYAFDAPDTIDAGATTIRLLSRGREQHFVQLIRISPPHTMSEFTRTLGAAGRTPWVTSVGGVGTIPPGGVASATLDLAPGLYAMLCDMEDAKGTPHMMEGMVRALTVRPAHAPAAMPRADIALRLGDYSFTMPDSLRAGAHVVDVRNAGSQPHMVLVWRLHAHESARDVVHWLDTPSDSEPPPVTLTGGVPDLDPGQGAELPVRWTPGRYLLICLVDDVRDHKPHYQHGMVRELTIVP